MAGDGFDPVVSPLRVFGAMLRYYRTSDEGSRRFKGAPEASGERSTLLELRDVRAAYEGITVLHGVDLSLAAGQVVALLGPNGAGKTTALRVAAGVHPIQSGRLLLGGRDVTGTAPRDLARAGVCLSPKDAACPPTCRSVTTC
jgi:ABC-type multidrug transport system fused ATPase/permease subunit